MGGSSELSYPCRDLHTVMVLFRSALPVGEGRPRMMLRRNAPAGCGVDTMMDSDLVSVYNDPVALPGSRRSRPGLASLRDPWRGTRRDSVATSLRRHACRIPAPANQLCGERRLRKWDSPKKRAIRHDATASERPLPGRSVASRLTTSAGKTEHSELGLSLVEKVSGRRERPRAVTMAGAGSHGICRSHPEPSCVGLERLAGGHEEGGGRGRA